MIQQATTNIFETKENIEKIQQRNRRYKEEINENLRTENKIMNS